MKLEKFILKIAKGFNFFSILSMGAMIAMLLECGIKIEFITCFALALFLYVSTSLKIKEDAEIKETEEIEK